MASAFLEGMAEAWLTCGVARAIAIVVVIAAALIAAWVLGGQA